MTLKIPEVRFVEIAGEAKARNVSKSQIARERLANRRVRIGKSSLWSRLEDLVMKADALPADLSFASKWP